MRILLTADPELPVPPKLYGGIERIVDGLAAELQARNHAVGLVAHPDSSCAVGRLFPWRGLGVQNFQKTFLNTCALWQAVRQFRPDVVHSFSRLGYLLPLQLTRVPSLMSYQRPTGGVRNRIAAQVGGRQFAFTGCSEHIVAQGRGWGGKWWAIPNFVDTSFYRFNPVVAADAPLVFLSRIERIKGAHTAIAIAKEAGRRLIIAGNRVNDGDDPDYWRTEIEPQLGRNGIEYVGPVNDQQKNELLGRAAAMLVPIQWDEPFGIVFAEALACGTPVISCPRGALPEIIESARHGYLINSIAEGVEAVGNIDAVSRLDCRMRAEEKFSRSVVTDCYEALYRELSREA